MANLKFYYGVMGAGKTTELMKTYEIYKRKDLMPVVVKPCIDDREGVFHGWGTTSSRLLNNQTIPAYYFKNLQKELPFLEYGVVLVDEAQFLSREDVIFLSKVVDKQDIDVIAYGLKTDVNGNLFEGSKELLIFADKIQELETLCEEPECCEKATFHNRYINGKIDRSGESISIEKGDVTYKSVCRKHWMNRFKGR